MAEAVIMPQLGETVAEGKILAWHKSVGDDVKAGDKLFEVETDKVTVEVEAIAAGKLTEIKVAAGVTAKVGATVAVIGGAAATAPPQLARNTASSALSVFEEVHTPAALHGKARIADGLAISPLARRFMAESGAAIDPIVAYATARGLRRVRERDVRAALAQGGLSSAVPPAQADAPLSAIRQKTAERLAENWRNIPHVFQTIEADFTRVDKVRLPAKDGFKQATGFSLTYLPFIARAVCLALRDFPNVNATFDGRSLSLKKEVNLGIAIDLSHNGLVVPVVKQAGDLTVEGLAKAIARLTEKARANKLTADDLSGGTYSITNNGAFGTLFTSPIINAPQVAILSTDAIRKRPVVVATAEGDFIAARTTGILGQSFDHRAFDGAYAASFLSRLRQLIETHDWSAEISGH
jgi:pyruvate/2-oxoglutarate dehydrogenase complex dihydrolipoamide acyltransferase (E2) component